MHPLSAIQERDPIGAGAARHPDRFGRGYRAPSRVGGARRGETRRGHEARCRPYEAGERSQTRVARLLRLRHPPAVRGGGPALSGRLHAARPTCPAGRPPLVRAPLGARAPMKAAGRGKGEGRRGRVDGRHAGELREVTIRRGYLKNAEGSALIEMGGTRVLCAATVEERVPPFLRNTGRGWVTAEYSMLPRSSHERITREVTRGHVGGRTHEIQRLIGRSLRAVTRLGALGERQITIDCDVIEADGGTRTASITGSFVALVDAIRWLRKRVELPGEPLQDFVAAVSVGIAGGVPVLDLCYEEDSK